jgi:tetratricopeptide (TPR) repeat protein
VLWHSFEPGMATFGLDGVITSIGLAVFGAVFARLDPPQRLAQVKRLLSQLRVLLVWDNFESVREMPDPAGVTPPLDEAGCAALRAFLEWVRDHSSSAVIITSRAQEEWLGQIRRIGVGGLNRAEAAQYAGHLLAPFPAAQARRERRSFGELLDWLDGHPLAMRLTLPRLDAVGPAELLAALRGTTPLPAADDPDAGRTTSLPASITYSYAHLAGQARRLLPAVSLFHGVADEDVLTAFSLVEGVPGRFAGISRQEWTAALQDAARVGLLTGLDSGMYQIHPALPGYLAAGWHAEDPARYNQERQACEQVLCTACAAFGRWLTGQIGCGDAALAYTVIGLQRRTLGAMLGHALDRHAWYDAQSIVNALDSYWDTRGLGSEASAWADRILDATAGPGQTPLAPALSLWLHTTLGQANRQTAAGQPDHAAHTYQRALAYLQDQPETGWTHSISVIYRQLGNTAYLRGRLDEADDWYRRSLTIKEELGDRPRIAGSYHQLGITAQARERLDEADDWYRQALTITEELGDRPRMALTYAQLGHLAEARAQAPLALQWNIRCVTLFGQFPSPLTGTGPAALARLTRQLGIPALEAAWQQITRPAPAAGRTRPHHQPPRRSAWRNTMTGPAANAARSSAAILAPDLGPDLPAEVGAALAARDTRQRPDRYLDPASLATLIVTIATLAWTIYNDQRTRTPDPPPSSIARQVRITLGAQGWLAAVPVW